MDDITNFFYQYLLYFLILLVSVDVFYLLYIRKSSSAKLPPGNKGLPFLGETLFYGLACKRGTPEKFLTDRSSKYSPDVFRSSLFGENVAVFCGASGNKFLLSNGNEYVTSWWPSSVTKTLIHPQSVNTFSFLNEVISFRSLSSQFLKGESLQNYIPIMDSLAKDLLVKEWLPNKQVIKVFPLVKNYTFTVACRLFAGITDPDQVARIYEPFNLLIAGLISLPINFPGTVYRRAKKASERIHKELSSIIAKKKIEVEEKKVTQATDMLTCLLLDGMSEIDISNKIVGFFVASHDNTSSLATFMIKYLADHPDVYSKVFQEQLEILKSKKPGDFLNWSDINRMKYTWCVACEVMRLAPASTGGFREVKTDFTYAGYTIPKGWKVFWTVHTTFKNPKYFPDPEKFDPSRFEGDGPAPFTFLPFGKGPRMCPGQEFTRVEVLAFLRNVVTKFKWETVNPNVKTQFILATTPVDGLPISLKLIET